jgi:hypothetical protein
MQQTVSDVDFWHFMSLFNMTIINTVAFLDEYQKFFGPKTEPQFKERIGKLKKCLKPVISELSKWKDLNNMRNEFAAHHMRSDKRMGAFIFGIDNITFDAPRNFYDLILISNLFSVVIQIIKKEFSKETEESNHLTMTGKEQENYIGTTKEDASSRTIKIANEVNALLAASGRKYQVEFYYSPEWSRL